MPFENLEQEFLGEDAFKPTELPFVAEIVDIQIEPMPENILRARQIDTTTQEFRDAFPEGVPCLMIGLKGIDVDYAFADDHVRRYYIPMKQTRGRNYGKNLGERSQLHIVAEAFDACFGIKPFGPANRDALIGKKARWGQHFGTMKDRQTGEKSTWNWDIPRQELPDDFVWEGPVRTIGSRNGETAPTLSDADAVKALIERIAGMDASDVQGACNAALTVVGLPNDYVNAALDGSLLSKLAEDGHIVEQEGTIAEPR